MSVSTNTTPRQAPGVLAQQVKPGESSVVLLNPRSGEYFTLEAVGSRVWQLCDGQRTISEIAATIGEEYDQAVDVIEGDVLELVKELVHAELVVTAV